MERPPRPITAGAVLIVALIVSMAGSYITFRSIQAAFAQHEAYDTAHQQLEKCQQLQSDEDAALRGYLGTGNAYFLQQYKDADYMAAFETLSQDVGGLRIGGASPLLLDLNREHAYWKQQIATPLISNSNAPDAVQRLERGKIVMDQIQGDYSQLADILGSGSRRLFDESVKLLRNLAAGTAATILLFGIAALVADVYRSRSQAALERERMVTDTLQRAFLSGWDLLPYLRVGTAYVSSTRQAAVGGDLFDVYQLDDHRALILVADVSGKGLGAAVDTAQVKYTVRTLAETERDPAAVLRRFNEIFVRSAHDPEAFVSLFLGVIDDRDLTLRYASAGHAPVFLRGGSQVRALPATGPVIGLGKEAAFTSERVDLNVGDVIVLATDGLTEARDQAGLMLGEDQAIKWIERGDADPQRLADEIVANVRRYAGGRIADDLALLVIRLQRAPVSDQVGDGRARHEVTPEPADGRAGGA
ncbi:MAG: SpoIIE family protein phosphatase [Candidatus Eremiobacteraeota bacterium]|nr:SpoIIE family protein phosphatase [Candidatus Eremiobacteraeota bacterium]MBV8222156.1 SpoIIE family protein phosphatase [Candidatus Eremiobacteraeota bacterium]MBV8280794.1 SpoIIE family protein phosphatase [Candidatus Eremiobacteraeota bacterium]